ncbi:response regulator [Vibrio sp. YMD68]|uniref:hybrid sensor histidine kinase/response regulator n=1 Tax=Vibrio sp. YMD68 TaxID=3042300 RepID=UPI00249CBE09|nr:response regulator [Vibrio sp. YMD68]WGW01358.1 response regulator [Vibrio sp. YMD68]
MILKKNNLNFVILFVIFQFLCLLLATMHYISIDKKIQSLIDEHEQARATITSFIYSFKNKKKLINQPLNYSKEEYIANLKEIIILENQQNKYALDKIISNSDPYDEMDEVTKNNLSNLLNHIFSLNSKQNEILISVAKEYHSAKLKNDNHSIREIIIFMFDNQFTTNQYVILLDSIEFLNKLNSWYVMETDRLQSRFHIVTTIIILMILLMASSVLFFVTVIKKHFIQPIFRASSYIENGELNKDRRLSNIRTRSKDCEILFKKIDSLNIKNGNQLKRQELYILEVESLKVLAERNYIKKSTFLSQMSHEIRTPLNSIIVGLQLFEQSEFKDKEVFSNIMLSSDILINIVNEILYIGKLEANEINLNLNETDLKDLVSSIKSIIQPLAKNNKIHIEIMLSNEIPLKIKIDKQKISQIVINIVNNAIIHANSKVVRIKISYNETESMIEFKIVDAGIGISKEKINLLFLSYKQLDEKSSFSTTGLGLSISKSLVIMMDGKIKVWSKERVGTCFVIKIPNHSKNSHPNSSSVLNSIDFSKGAYDFRTYSFLIKQLSVLNLDSNKIVLKNNLNESNFKVLDIFSVCEFYENNRCLNDKVIDTTVRGKNISNIKIVVAEDYKLNINIMKKVAQQHELNFDFVHNGQELIELLSENLGYYDLILMDIQMPIMDGLEATKYIRQVKLSHIPIIGLSANVEIESQKACFSAGMNAFIQKPFDIIELKKLIIELCS